MGNELNNEYIDKEPEDYESDCIRYGVISQKWGEKTNDDSYLSLPDQSISDKDKTFNYSLFGVFDGHNSDYVSQYLSKNFQKLYEKEVGNINKDNYQSKIEEIFKAMDKQLKGEQKENIQETNKEEENNIINTNNDDTNTENGIKCIDVSVKDSEINLIKESIQNGQDIPEDLKDIDDSEIKDLLLFKNLFQYNNNYLYNNNNLNYIGSSASVVLINDNNIITADLGLTKCILFNKDGIILNNKEKIFEDHTFKNKEEKKRIKKFNKSIDYESLKINFYVPASRSFGFFEYKENEVLNEENQIISCVPDVNIYDRKGIDFILLVSKGMSPTNDSLKKLLDKIKNVKKDNNGNEIEIKLTDVINEYIKYKKEEIKRIASRKNPKIPKVNTGTPKAEH